jgi:hypothetical protein
MTPREEIEAVRSEVLQLHKKLVDLARRQYEAQHGGIARGQLTRLVAFDPEFAWLHPLTRLVLDIDDRLEQGPLTPDDVAEVRSACEEVFGAPASGLAQFPSA